MFWSDFDYGTNGRRWDYRLAGLRQLQDEVNRLFKNSAALDACEYGRTSLGSGSDAAYPGLNVHANQEMALVVAELPGVDSASLDLSILGKVLTIKGERSPVSLGENEHLLRRERGTGAFSRSVELPFVIDSDKVAAEYKNGLLSVKLPRAEADKPKRIPLN